MIEIEEEAGATKTGAKLAVYVGTGETEYFQAVKMGITHPTSGLPNFKRIRSKLGLEPELMQTDTDTSRWPFRGRKVKRQERCP